MKILSSLTLKLLAVIFYLLALFFILADAFPVFVDNLIYVIIPYPEEEEMSPKIINAVWHFDEKQLVDSMSVAGSVSVKIDTKWHFLTYCSDDPAIIFRYRTYSNGKWSELDDLTDYPSCGVGTGTSITKDKNKISFNNVNYLYEKVLLIYYKYIRKHGIVDETFDPNSFSMVDPKLRHIVYPDSYTAISEALGDSVQIQLSCWVMPVRWSNYDFQEVFSPAYKFSAKEVYTAFEENLKRLQKQALSK